MESENCCESNFISHEEEYQSYDIYIEKNPDPYRGGFIWSVGNESEEIETGLSFTLGSAIEDAQKLADELGNSSTYLEAQAN